ncbi:ATP-dependent DNA ligase [Streptomyces winkii]|uniref:ATP-dependent DNA ligase n=1 Tax=Streptomyces winkii TaxID=3051178 RepID=UPI0028D840F6|nr:DNA ligase [Streptomyces sp. DSM 40971]
MNGSKGADGADGTDDDGAGAALVVPLPVELVRPKPVEAVPDGPGWHHSIKLDGWRVSLAVTDDGVRIHSRSKREITRQFPELVAAARELGAGTVIDGEVVVWSGQQRRFDFEALQSRGLAKRPRSTPGVVLVAFDVLAAPYTDLRSEPLSVRWPRLRSVVEQAGPEIQLVLATDDAGQARDWMREMRPQGVEGIVSKRWDSPYRPGRARTAWRKVRSADTVDARLVGVTGPERRPWGAVVELPDGRRAVTTPRLAPVAASGLGRAVEGLLGETVADDELDVRWRPLTGTAAPLTVEVTVRTGRVPLVRYVRVRADV